MTKVQEQCTAMVMSAAFWAAVRGRILTKIADRSSEMVWGEGGEILRQCMTWSR
jgi:hypothetical protein